MDLKDIISISGKSGLFSTVGKSKNNVIVESIIDKKRFPIFNTNRISALSDISIYTYEEEMLLSDIYRKIYESNDGKPTIDHSESKEKLRAKLEEFVPNYDKEQVYNSDIKKLFQWINLLSWELHDRSADFKDTLCSRHKAYTKLCMQTCL